MEMSEPTEDWNGKVPSILCDEQHVSQVPYTRGSQIRPATKKRPVTVSTPSLGGTGHLSLCADRYRGAPRPLLMV